MTATLTNGEATSAWVAGTVPKISVLLPVFNAQRFLSEAIRSILSQSMSDFELLIIDDGSTDQSLQIIRTLSESDRRIRFSSRENRGLVDTLNELLGRATGAFIARMDADDVADPRRFELQLQEFERDPSLLAVGSDVHSIDSKGRHLMTITMPGRHQDIDAFTMGVTRGSGMCHPSMMFRASAFELAGNYRKEFWPAEDADLILRLAEKGRLVNLALPLLCYRVHADSIGHTQASRQRDALYRAAASAAARRGIPAPDAGLRTLGDAEREEIETPLASHVKWAWWALNTGNVKTARSLAMNAVLKSPLSKRAWVVLACAIRGH